jgi:hypothetical protein
MASQVVTVIENQLPCEPELAALSQMAAPIVMVHKITKGEKGKENTQLVINGAQGMSLDEILKLQDLLPTGQLANSGPGVYRFAVTDRDSAAKVSWQTRLGGAVAENPIPTPAPQPAQALPFGMPFTASAVRAVAPTQPAVTPSTGVRSIGNGVYYDPELALLTLPDGSVHPWRPGTPLPAAATTAVLQPPAPQATPMSAFAGPGSPFFAQQPSPELEATKVALASVQRALEESQRQRAQDQAEAARQKEMADLRDSIKALAERLTARPGDNPELAELKRRMESQDMLAALQASTKAQIDAIMALVSNNNRGVDPMVTFMTSMMKDGQMATAETLRLIRETAGAERQTFLTMLDRQAAAAEKAAANNPFEKVGSVVDILVEKVGRVMQMERDFSGSNGGGVDWVGLIKEAVSKAGSAVEMYQNAKAQEASAVEARAKAQIVTAQAQASISRDRALVAARGKPGATPLRAVPAAAPVSPTRVKVELPDLEKATLPELREVFSPERDEVFFGSFFDHVKQLREGLASAPAMLGAKKIAELLMQARATIAEAVQAGTAVPHAVEIWAHGQLPYLLERLLPEASEGLRSEVVKALTQLQAEADDAERIAANTTNDEDEDVS